MLLIREYLYQSTQRRYEDAIKAHAEAITLAENWKSQLSEMQSAARESEIRAETTQSKLSLSEASWGKQKELIDKEMADINKRYAPQLRVPAGQLD
jgi:nucleoprotein TPR